MRRWFEIAIPVPASLVDEAAALLDYAGFGGVEVRERGDRCEVVVVVESDGDAAEERTLASESVAILGAGEARVSELDPKVWTENWKKHFSRRVFANRVEVRPPWEEASDESAGLVSIVINPGMAFGTGLHETTAGCLELLADEIRGGEEVADVGCGSGILAIAAVRLGASKALATDVDPLAVEATRENIDANAVGDRVEVELEPGEVGVPEWERDARPGLSSARDREDSDTGPPASMRIDGIAKPNDASGGGFIARGPAAFDVLVANILAETLVELHEPLTSALRSGGRLILSGIEARRLKIVEEAFIRPPWSLARKLTKGDWISLSLHREALAEPAPGPSVAERQTGSGSSLKK